MWLMLLSVETLSRGTLILTGLIESLSNSLSLLLCCATLIGVLSKDPIILSTSFSLLTSFQSFLTVFSMSSRVSRSPMGISGSSRGNSSGVSSKDYSLGNFASSSSSSSFDSSRSGSSVYSKLYSSIALITSSTCSWLLTDFSPSTNRLNPPPLTSMIGRLSSSACCLRHTSWDYQTVIPDCSWVLRPGDSPSWSSERSSSWDWYS